MFPKCNTSVHPGRDVQARFWSEALSRGNSFRAKNTKRDKQRSLPPASGVLPAVSERDCDAIFLAHRFRSVIRRYPATARYQTCNLLLDGLLSRRLHIPLVLLAIRVGHSRLSGYGNPPWRGLPPTTCL